MDRKKELKYDILTAMFFLLGAFTMWEFLYEICNMIGSIVEGTPARTFEELRRMLPVLLTPFAYLSMAVGLFNSYRSKDGAERRKTLRKNSVVCSVFGVLISGYVIFGWAFGQYERFIEGFLSPLFPFDIFLGGLLILLYGIGIRQYAKKIPDTEKGACITGKFRLFHIFSYMAAMLSFAACFYGTYVMDWSHGMLFFNIMLWLNYFTAFFMAVVYRFVYAKAPSEKRSGISKKWGLFFLVQNTILYALYLLSVEIYNEAPNQNAFGILPIEFTASFNAFMLIFGINNILAPLVAVFKGRSAQSGLSPDPLKITQK